MFTANSWQSSNALLGVLPALAVPFATWSILDDDRRAWPWLALAASYAVQADLAFLIPIALLVAMALVHELRRLRRGTAPQVHEDDRSGHALLATVLILVVLWIPPVIDALANRGGNLAALLEAATADIPVRGIGYATSSIITMLVPVVVTSPFWVRAWRADRPARRPLMAVAAVGTFGVAWSQAMVPVGDAPSLTQLPVYVGISFNLFASAAFTADVLLAGRARRPVLLRRVSWAGFAATALLAAPALTGASFQDEWYPAVRPVTAAIADLPGDQYRVQPLGGPVATRLALGLADATQRKGVRLRVQRALVPYLGANHQMTADVDQVLYVSTQSTAPPVSGAKLVERWEDPAFDERARARVDRAVAREIRRRPVRWSSTDDFQIGSIVAAGGTQLDHIDDVTISELGQDVRSGRVDVRDLPDAVIAELVFQNMIQLPPSSTRLGERLTRSRAATVATVWLAAA